MVLAGRRAPVELARVGRGDSHAQVGAAMARVGADPMAGIAAAIALFAGAGAVAGGGVALLLGKSWPMVALYAVGGSALVLGGAYAYFQLGARP